MQARRFTFPSSIGFVGFGAVLSLALAHVAVLAFVRPSDVASNIVQFLATLLAVVICLERTCRAREYFFRYVGLQLGIAFTIWLAAQSMYLVTLMKGQHAPAFPSTADVLWLLYAFPILMVTVTRRTGTKWDWVNLLDAAQAGLFFFVLDALVLSHSRLISNVLANDVQGIALCLAGAIRYSMAAQGEERLFFRNLCLYLTVSAVCTSLILHMGKAGFYSRWADLCWTVPFLFFCALVLSSARFSSSKREPASTPVLLHGHLQAVSALGLAILSTLAGAGLEMRHHVAGLIVLAVAFLLFAVRTSARELQLHAAHKTVQHAALHDALTGLANRVQLRSHLTERLQTGDGGTARLALLFVDLDRFKTVNDGLGHAFGDQLLLAIADVMRSLARERGDLLAHLGGDEFMVLTECGSESEAQNRANAYIHRLRQPITLDGRVLHMTASLGVVLAEPGISADDLLRNAACALHAAKHRGKNQTKLFEPAMMERASDELWLETDLRETLESGGITVHYQPIYCLSGREIVGFEALARWHHPTRGMISPALFIPVAEETGLILELGRQVLQEACLQMGEWNKIFRRHFYVSVNVSARQFADAQLLPKVKHILDQSGFPPELLKLEITESVLIGGVQTVESVLTAARRLGIEISLDDFGTGYSSLSYLLRIPFDVVKIDRSFVQSLDRDPQRAKLAEMIIQLAIRLGKKVVAEGVETVEEQRLLEGMRCDLLQGYLFSKPLAPNAVEGYLEEYSGPASRFAVGEAPIWLPARTDLALIGSSTAPAAFQHRWHTQHAAYSTP